MTSPRRLAVVGAGWAGLAAAVRGVQRGAQVTLLEMATTAGGRACSLKGLDNGAHILIGAYTQTLALMRTVGADPDALLARSPLDLRDAAGAGLVLPPGPPALAFARGVLGWRALPLRERLVVLAQALHWRLSGFTCDPALTVADWAAALPAQARHHLIAPLCLAALNTAPASASAQVLLRVLHDALFAGPGSADLLLPRAPLSALLPEAAVAWLARQGADLRLGQRCQRLQPASDEGWAVDGQRFDAVILATPWREAARLAAPLAPAWAEVATALPPAAIATVWLHAPAARWPRPMLALQDGPAQFGFDLGALGGPAGHYALSVSAVGDEPVADAARRQFMATFEVAATAVTTRTQRHATFACTPGLQRPSAAIAPGLWAAGDYVQGPYPATLEGAVRAGLAAAEAAV